MMNMKTIGMMRIKMNYENKEDIDFMLSEEMINEELKNEIIIDHYIAKLEEGEL